LATYQNFERISTKLDPLYQLREKLLEKHMSRRNELLWQLQLNFSLLFYGVGSKKGLLDRFIELALSGEDVLSIDGRVEEGGGGGGGGGGHGSSTKVAKALLDTICSSVLRIPHLGVNCLGLDSYAKKVNQALLWHYHRKHAPLGRPYYSQQHSVGPGAAGTGTAQEGGGSSSKGGKPPVFWVPTIDKTGSLPGFEKGIQQHLDGSSTAQRFAEEAPLDATSDTGGRHAHALPKLYIVANSVDGVALQSPESQRVLATLAECPAVALIATADKLNAPLLWSNELLDKYRWFYVHNPTYESYELSADFALLNSKGRQGNMQAANANALGMILASLTPRHKELFTLLAKESIKEGQDSHKGILMDRFFDKAVKAMLVTTRPGLQNYLREFIDHKVVSTSTDAAKKEWVRITLPRSTIEEMCS
jgi:hypothetical protein